MKISIVGNGNMAKGIAKRFLVGGHQVELHVRDMQKGEAAKAAINPTNPAMLQVVELGSPAGDIFIPTVHYGAEMEDIARLYAEGVAGKLVVDISNPVDFNTFQLIPPAGRAGAEEVAKLFPKSTVIKAFNTIFAGTLAEGTVAGMPLDVFIAGDDTGAKETLSQLISDSGMRPLDSGPLSNARHLEGIELIHMTLQEQVRGNWQSALQIVA